MVENKSITLVCLLLFPLLMHAQINREASQQPPAGLKPQEVPMFVSFGFDDNTYSGDKPGDGNAMTWILNYLEKKSNPKGAGNVATFDGTPCRVSFFVNSKNYTDAVEDDAYLLMKIYNTAYKQGHEIGNHTHSHKHGEELTSVEAWQFEMRKCSELLSNPVPLTPITDNANAVYGPSIMPKDIRGYRTPYLEYEDSTFKAAYLEKFYFDSSIEEGFEPAQDGTNYYWPYTLDNGSPGYSQQFAEGERKSKLGNYPGMWEFPNYALIAPPDDSCVAYGLQPGFRKELATRFEGFDPADGKITGFDYNLWTDYKFSKIEFLAILKYSFNLRYNGNRCPFSVGAHSQFYHPDYQSEMPRATIREAQEAVEEFIAYVLTKPEVRIVPMVKILKWCENPSPLKK